MSGTVVPNPRQNARTGFMAAAFFVGMVGVAYAAVPLYKLFCQATGFGGTPVRAEQNSRQIVNKIIRVRFDANVDSSLPWRFSPVLAMESPKVGANMLAYFEAENMSDKPITGQATFNVSPAIAAPYFTKVQCFCFTEQTLQPGEKVSMPVSYFIDPRIMDDKQARLTPEITLSYTFYRVEQPTQNQQTAAVTATSQTALR
jgi:cytochrome c oxidase assembly protein subunit 11